MKRISLPILITLVVATTAFAGSSYLPTDAERARWTMGDMQSWRICLEAYKIDHGSYPATASIDEVRAMVEPTYIKRAPLTDAWGNPYRYSLDAKGVPRLVSAGSDGKFDDSTWNTEGEADSFDGDAVMSPTARWMFRRWAIK